MIVLLGLIEHCDTCAKSNNDGLHLEELLEAEYSHLAPVAGALVTAERRLVVDCVVARPVIEINAAGLDPLADTARLLDIIREDITGQAVGVSLAISTAWSSSRYGMTTRTGPKTGGAGIPRPGAIGILNAGAFGNFDAPPDNPGSWGGDSRYTAAPLGGDPPLPADPAKIPPLPTVMTAYMRGVNLGDPLASPALSKQVLAQFPPSLVITSTRGFDMSAAVEVITRFFDQHLGH